MIATAPTPQTSAPLPAPSPGTIPNRAPAPPLTVIILTLNAQASLPQVIDSCNGLTTRLLVVDTFSTDATVGLSNPAASHPLQHPFHNYASHPTPPHPH